LHRVGHRHLRRVASGNISPSHNKLVISLIPGQPCCDFLSDIHGAELCTAKKLTLPVQKGDRGKDALWVCRKVIEEQQRLHVIGWVTAPAVKEVSLEYGLRASTYFCVG